MFRSRDSFAVPLGPCLVIGIGLTAALYWAVGRGPLHYEFLADTLLRNPISLVAVALFFTTLSGCLMKWMSAKKQLTLASEAEELLEGLVLDGSVIDADQRGTWLESQWLSQPGVIQNSYLGRRLTEVLGSRAVHGRPHTLEADIRDHAAADITAQRSSSRWVRAVFISLLILGVVNAVFDLKRSMTASGSVDVAASEMVITQPMIAHAVECMVMPWLLALVVLLVHTGLENRESMLATEIDRIVRTYLIEFLVDVPQPVETGDSSAAIRALSADVVQAVYQLVEQQAIIWNRSITEAQSQWSSWSETAADRMRTALSESLALSLSNHATQIEKIQQEAARQVDSRWQQWQITLSDQARVMHGQQKELVRQTEAIERLIQASTELKKLEDVVRDSFSNFDQLERLRQASMCVGEAVAVLATSLERAGVIRGAPVKPRAARATETPTSATESDTTSMRKAA